MVPLTKRQKDIIEYLARNDEFIKIKNISEKFNISERTVRYDLDNIKHYLKSQGFELVKKTGIGVKIIKYPNSIDKLSNILSDLKNRVFSPKERAFLILIYILTSNENITMEELSNLLQVSKNTIVTDMIEVERNLLTYSIKLKKKTNLGLTIEGEEENIRNSFIRIYYEGLRNSFITKDFIKKILESYNFYAQDIISAMEKEMNISYSDISKEELEILLLYTFNRAKSGNHIYYSEELKKKYIEKREYKALLNIFNLYNEFQFLNESDLCYVTRVFMGAKIINTIQSKENSLEDEEAKIISKQIVQDAEEYIGIDLSDDYEFINFMAIHLKVAIHRLRNNLIIENPLTEQIKFRISFIYEITTKIVSKYENMLGLKFPEDEIAFIAMYLGAAFEKKTQNGFMPRVLVVCGSGIATSGILSTRLQIMIPEIKIIGPVTVDEIKNKINENKIDFIITTVDIKVPEYDVIKVNPLLDVSDIEQIKKLIFKNTYKKQCDYFIKRYDIHQKNKKLIIGDFIKEENIKFNVNTDNWREAVKIAAKPLIEKKYICKEYVNSIIEAVERLGPYMVFIPGIAFAHASPKNYVRKECINLITLNNELDFGDDKSEKIKILVVFAVEDEKSSLLSNFVSILENDDNISKIKIALKYDEIKDLSN